MIYSIRDLVTVLDVATSTARKRELLGGFLMSLAVFFGGLSITLMTIDNEVKENKK